MTTVNEIEYDPKWELVNNEELIEHILTRYHDTHRQQIVELIELADRVESVHADDAACPKGLTVHLTQVQAELLSHMEKEEQILFPMLNRGMYEHAVGPISVMESEHVSHAEELNKIYQLTNNLTLPSDACNTWRTLYSGLETFVNDLRTHIKLENEVLFSAEKPMQPKHGESFCCGSCGG